MLSGHRPRLLKEGLSWDPFIADRDLIHCSHQPHDADIRTFIETAVDTRLYNVLRDLHTFSCISNLAYETTRKLSPDIYNEIIISLLYRLTHLSFENESNPLQESLRTGLMTFSWLIFMQRDFMRHPYDHLLKSFSNAILRLRRSTEIDLPVPITLWLTMLLHLVAPQDSSSSSPATATDWHTIWLDEVISHKGITSWVRAREILRSVVWVGFIHDGPGKRVFEEAVFRLHQGKEQQDSTPSRL